MQNQQNSWGNTCVAVRLYILLRNIMTQSQLLPFEWQLRFFVWDFYFVILKRSLRVRSKNSFQRKNNNFRFLPHPLTPMLLTLFQANKSSFLICSKIMNLLMRTQKTNKSDEWARKSWNIKNIEKQIQTHFLILEVKRNKSSQCWGEI